ncbi:hypothetical protein DY000_02048113 [Brassica cretica]|uniref:Uncharacterized protein n=1 Tax=Brassica cretica TaxID=69181 RepID=A0ABQ7F1Q1_BRACR|nr:hypothetical protein DY000_02048113 [Brassica cretica]
MADNFEQLLDDALKPMQVDQTSERRTLRKTKEKVPKHLKRGVNKKEMDSFTKRVLRIPLDKPFEEAYFTHRLWMFFRETKETEQDIHRVDLTYQLDGVYYPLRDRDKLDEIITFSQDLLKEDLYQELKDISEKHMPDMECIIGNLQHRMHASEISRDRLKNQWTRGDEARRRFIGTWRGYLSSTDETRSTSIDSSTPAMIDRLFTVSIDIDIIDQFHEKDSDVPRISIRGSPRTTPSLALLVREDLPVSGGVSSIDV